MLITVPNPPGIVYNEFGWRSDLLKRTTTFRPDDESQ